MPTTWPSPPATARPGLLRAQPPADLRPAERNWLVGGVAAAHLVGLWGLMQLDVVQDAVRQVAPLMVDFIAVQPPPAPPRPSPPSPPPPLPQRQPVPRAAPVPLPVMVAATTPTPSPAAVVVTPPTDVPPAAQTLQAPPAVPTPTAPAAPPAPPPAPPQPRLLPASTIAYRVPPPVEVPLASRRLGEQGLVLLRVRVGVDGLPRQVSVQRSSGFARLDEQALSAMRRARFTPQTEQGVAIEWIVVAPLQYEIE